MLDIEAKQAPADDIGRYQAMRRLVLGILIVVIFGCLLFGQSLFPPETVVHETVEMVGVLLIFLGIVGRLWASLVIGGRKSAEVVSDGPYSITRNPLYLFSALAAIGVGAQMGSVVTALGFGLLCWGAFHVVILREERYLSGILGQPYADYLARVPRFLPDTSLYHEGDGRGFQSRALLTTLLDGLVFLVAMPVFELIDLAQETGALPVLFRLP